MKKVILASICVFIAFITKAQDFKIEEGQLVLPSAIVFETGTAKLKPESEVSLRYIKQFLDAKSAITLIRIEGHSDRNGNSEENQILTEKRALAVSKWLADHGIDCKRLIAVGFGDNKPVADNSTSEGKALNRRMEIRMASLMGRAIGGMPLDGGGKVAGDSCK